MNNTFRKSWSLFGFYVFLLLAFLPCSAQSTDKNYIITRTYKSALTSVSGNVKDASQQVIYFDGLGRPLQSISAHASPQLFGTTPADLVSHTEYDAYGRISKIYAPYPVQGNGTYQSSAGLGSNNYYNSSSNFCLPSDRGYTLSEYESSPLNRIKKQFATGTDHAVEYYYGVNSADEVKRYDVSGSGVSQPGNYGANQLTFTENKDENGSRVREYKDKDGRVILKRAYNGGEELSTYYVYNDLTQLSFVLQPKYQDESDLDKYAFKYQYNDRGLTSSKYVPGGGTTQMYYDDRDRLIRSTDGRGINTYIKYDELNRVIETGEGIAGQSENALVRTHYDNYSSWFGGTDGFSSIGDGYPSSNRSNVTGLTTVTATRVLNPDGSYGGWLNSTVYYDERYNVIQIIQNLYDLGGTSKERVTRQISFNGRIEKELTVQETGTGNYLVEKLYTYDHGERLLNTRYVVKKNDVVQKDIILSANRYDALGQIKNKFLQSNDGGSNFREQLEHCFTPRNWMSKVTGKTSLGDNFGVELKYTNPLNTSAQYNGNIAEMLWRQGTGAWVGYKLSYDGANRLTNSEGINGNSNRESIPGYDKNGNITSLQRYFNGDNRDNLTYNYNGNRITKITDASGNSEGFNNGSSGDGDDFAYDGNGNSVRDQNRGINNGDLRYNYLNLPREVVVNGVTLQYHYDGVGVKLRMSNSNNAANTKYAGIFEYGISNYPTRIATEEGQISITNNGVSATDYTFQYYLKDHLGNTRMVMNESGTMVQETEYFAFGLAIPKIVNANPYLYNGKEKQPETGFLDYGARIYMPEIGRWNSVDPMTEIYENWSSYSYVFNNPINWTDPDGRCPTCPQGDEAKKVYAEGAVVTNQYGSWTWTGGEWQANLLVSAGSQVMAPVSGFIGWGDQFWNGNRTYADGREINSSGVLLNKMKPRMGTPPDVGIGKVGSVEKIGASFRNILGTYGWSSRSLARAAKELASGKIAIKVATRADAEELFLGLFQGKGFRNTTGMSAKEAKDFIGKASTYHWDDATDTMGRLINHSASNAHGAMKHLQIHDESGKIIRIFFEQ